MVVTWLAQWTLVYQIPTFVHDFSKSCFYTVWIIWIKREGPALNNTWLDQWKLDQTMHLIQSYMPSFVVKNGDHDNKLYNEIGLLAQIIHAIPRSTMNLLWLFKVEQHSLWILFFACQLQFWNLRWQYLFLDSIETYHNLMQWSYLYMRLGHIDGGHDIVVFLILYYTYKLVYILSM